MTLCFVYAMSMAAVGAATVTTDQSDYSPASTVTITGSGFAAGETITVQVLHVDGTLDNATSSAHLPWEVVADASGNFTSTWLVPADQDELFAELVVSAVGSSSGESAVAFFTDAGITGGTAAVN